MRCRRRGAPRRVKPETFACFWRLQKNRVAWQSIFFASMHYRFMWLRRKQEWKQSTYTYIYAKRESHRLSSNKECKIFFHNFLSTSSRFFKDLIFQIETFHIYTVRCFHLTSLFQFQNVSSSHNAILVLHAYLSQLLSN